MNMFEAQVRHANAIATLDLIWTILCGVSVGVATGSIAWGFAALFAVQALRQPAS